VKGCDLLTLGDEERESLDTLIDRVYDDLDKGQFLLHFNNIDSFYDRKLVNSKHLLKMWVKSKVLKCQ